MGVAGAGVALILFNVGSRSCSSSTCASAHSAIRLAETDSSAGSSTTSEGRIGLSHRDRVANLTVVVTTGLVGAHGRDAIAGYGLAARWTILLIPRSFALRTAR